MVTTVLTVCIGTLNPMTTYDIQAKTRVDPDEIPAAPGASIEASQISTLFQESQNWIKSKLNNPATLQDLQDKFGSDESLDIFITLPLESYMSMPSIPVDLACLRDISTNYQSIRMGVSCDITKQAALQQEDMSAHQKSMLKDAQDFMGDLCTVRLYGNVTKSKAMQLMEFDSKALVDSTGIFMVSLLPAIKDASSQKAGSVLVKTDEDFRLADMRMEVNISDVLPVVDRYQTFDVYELDCTGAVSGKNLGFDYESSRSSMSPMKAGDELDDGVLMLELSKTSRSDFLLIPVGGTGMITGRVEDTMLSEDA